MKSIGYRHGGGYGREGYGWGGSRVRCSGRMYMVWLGCV